MDVKFDLDAIMENPELNDLTWEIIEARGIAAGDLVALWDTALAMGRSCRETSLMSLQWMTPDEYGDIDEVSLHIGHTYNLLSKFLARDAREIVKFLKKRGFEFPDEHIGKRPPDAWGA